LSKDLSIYFEYFEVLLLINEADYKKIYGQTNHVKNLRMIVIRSSSNHYEKRSICARESIGDIVIISTTSELNSFNISELLLLSISKDAIVLSKKESLSLIEKFISHPLLFLGKIVGLEINLGLYRTIVFPRTLLNLILDQEYLDLKLRFPPSNSDFNIIDAVPTSQIKRNFSDIESKLSLIYMLLLNLTPYLLKQLTLLSGAGIFFSFSYLIYAIIIFLFLPDIQSGWFTLSIAISGTAFFLTTSIFIISIGIQHLLANFKKNSIKSFYEIDAINLYKNAESDLNIEINHSDDLK
ncbi:hypothetical protein N8Z60_03570, partial [Gammaproteobacteria bacterium]|nr:hypothetical protein [Gammaproteobacteria bacterium]